MSILSEHIKKNGSTGLNAQIVNKSAERSESKDEDYSSGRTSILQEHISKNGSAGLNQSIVTGEKKDQYIQPVDTSKVYHETKKNDKFSMKTALKDAGWSVLNAMASIAATGAMAENAIGGVVEKIFKGTEARGTGLFNTLYYGNTPLAKALGLTGIKDFTQQINEEAAANAEKINTGNEKADKVLKKSANIGNELAYGIGYAAPMAATAMVSAPAAAANGLASVGSNGLIEHGAQVVEKSGLLNMLTDKTRQLLTSKDYWEAFVQEVGMDYDEARDDGATEDQAMTYAIATSLINSGIEIGDPAEMSGLQNAAQPLWRSALQEGKEEIEQGPFSRWMKNVVYGKGAPMVSMTDEDAVFNPAVMGKEFAMGAAVGGLLGAGQRVIGSVAGKAADASNERKANRAYSDVYGSSTEELAQEAQDIGNTSETAQRVAQQAAQGQEASGADLRTLVEENQAIIEAQNIWREQEEAQQEPATPDLQITGKLEIPEMATVSRETEPETPVTSQVRNSEIPNSSTDNGLKALETVTDRNGLEDVAENATTTQPQENDAKNMRVEVTEKSSATGDKTVTLDEAAKKYGKQSEAFKKTYHADQDVTRYDNSFQAAYNYGRSGVPYSAVKSLDSVSYLTETQREIAYESGAAAATGAAELRVAKNNAAANGNTGRKVGTIKGEGVSMSDLKSAFNDQQGRSYRVLSTVAEATGVDIVLYKSEADENGEYRGSQGRFQRSDDKIYIDLNAGLRGEMDVNDLGKYAMLRTFSHEFTHFIEKWNPVRYNEFRKAVFAELTARGENVNDLIEEKAAKTGLSYEAASREVVAEAMTDILPDSHFINNLCENHKSLFDRLLEKLKEFAADLRAYFQTIGKNRSREANALKEQVGEELRYLESIVKMYDAAAAEAVESYQKANAVQEAAEETSATAEVKTTTSPYGFTVTDNPEYGTNDVQFSEKPGEEIRDVLKKMKFRWNGKRKVWYGSATHEEITEALDEAYAAEKKTEETTTPETASHAQTGAIRSLEELRKALETRTRVEAGNLRFTIDEVEIIKGKPQYHLKVVNTADDVYGGMITNARSLLYDQVLDTREEAVDTAANIARNINLFEETAKEEKPNEEVREQIPGGETVRENNDGAVLQPESDGEGAARLLDEVQAGDVQRSGEQREAVEPVADRGGQDQSDRDRQSANAGRSGSERTGESGDLRRNGSELTEEEQQQKEETLRETVSEQIEQQSTETPKGKNFTIGDSLNLPTGEKARFRANVDAIKLIKQLETDGRYATAEEQETLSKYVGWGGLSNAFGEMAWNSETRKREMVAKNGWEKEFAEFRQLVDDGVITEQEYSDMSASTKNAHYTSVEVIKAMYDGLAQLGFTGGRMLEPSSGVGNFVGGMPASMSQNVKSWTMVELDRITGQIAKYLYPNADVRIQGFQEANIPDNYMDVAIGNVPFGNYGVVDRHYPKRITKAIHNYFFAKTLDKVRPGGVVMFITSSFTMNGQDTSIRQYIMDRADLLGAIRLPNTAFSGNAGTEVVTDILVLKKRNPGTEYAGEAFLEAPYRAIGESWQGANVNEYFDNHPEMVLGTAELARGMYGANSLTYAPLKDKGTLGDQIREAFKNITGKMDYESKATPEKSNFSAERAGKKTKQGGLEVKDGKVYRNVGGNLEAVSEDKSTADRVSGLLHIRDAYRNLVDYLQQGQDEKYIKQARKELNKAYDDFVKKYGLINSAKNKSVIVDDPDSYSILSLENYNSEKKTATKADIFTKDTITANKTITHVDDVPSGIIVSINRTGGIDTSLIAKITGKTEEAVTREMIESRMAFKTKDGKLEAPETYLSGNVRAKLREAEALAPLDSDFQNNVEELQRVIPKDIPFNDIYVSVGTPWIPNSVYADFIAETLGGYNRENGYSGPDVTVGRTNSGEFKIVVNNKRLRARYQNTQQWGTRRRTFLDLMETMMSNGSLNVNDYIEDENGRKRAVLNKVETAAAQAKAEEITKEFQEWLWRNETRRKELASLYNETFNALVPPKYSGEHLTVNGLNASFSLREHQSDAVQRIISSGGNTLLAHKVGAGKTLEMAAAAMKLRELGIVKKPVFVVPKSLVAQWGVEFKSYFPASKLLVADEKSFTKANRKTFANRIANGDYDAVILSYEQFEKIPMSADYQQQFYQQQIDEILDAIAEEKAESQGKGITVKEMEKKKAQLEKKIAELTTKAKDEDNIDFEQLGIDSLFVDEAHNFKNLQYVTRMNNISGLGNTNGSQRAFDLYTKIRYLQGLNGGRGIVFATATPVMNSMAEMYIMQKYLQSDMLEQLGLKTFDAWAKQFGEVVNSVEIKPSGQGFRVKQTFSNFRNLNELQMLFRSFSDVLTNVPGLKIPKMKNGKVTTVVCEPGQFQKDYMAELEKRADNVKNVDPSEDNMLKITSDGRKVSYTQRMIDPTLPYEPGCKIYRCCDNVLAEYKASKDEKGTQIIFCDMATPKGKSKTAGNTETEEDTAFDTESAKLYDDMKSYLVKRGIPAKEIAFIHDADTDAKKKQLFSDVNEGKVRVLIGSTGKMGVGMNAQKRIVAIHHMDAPWRPGDVEQRDGRAFRQGNMNDEVSKYTYVTEGSFDARLWDILDRKQHFIEQIMNGDDVGRSAEDTGDVTLSAAEVKALASGNPMIMEQVQLSNDISKLNDLKKAYNSSITAAMARLRDDEQKIGALTKNIANIKEDIKARVDTYSDGKFSMKIGNRTFTEKKDAGAALAAEIAAKSKQDEFVTVGSFAGFNLRVIKQGAEYSGLVSGKQGYKFNVYPENTTYMVNHIIGIVENLEAKEKTWTENLAEAKTDLAAQEKMIKEPFAKQEELDQKQARYNEVMEILNPKEEQVIGDDTTQEQSREFLEEDIQYQDRTSPLTDREVLSIAAEEVSVDDMTDGEKDALRIFKQRLNSLYELEQKRAELGRLYKEQQFGKNVDRAAAEQTRNRMLVLDGQISKANAEVLDVEKKEVLRRVLQKSRKVVENEERKHGKELLNRYRDRQRNAAEIKKYRERIKADTDSLKKWILHPSNKDALRRVPDALKNSVIPFLSSIDFTSKQQLRGGAATAADREFIKSMKAVKAAIKHNIDVDGMYARYSGYFDLPEGFMDDLQGFIDSAQVLANSQDGQFVINRMTSEELKTLSRLVRLVKKLVVSMNSFHQNAMFQHAYEAGDSSIDFMDKLGDWKATKNEAKVSEFLLWQQMRPAYAFERFGKGGISIYDEFRRGQAELAFNTIKIKEFAESVYTDAEVKAWEKETKTFILGGEKVTIPVSYIMGLYELQKRPQAVGHLLGAGMRVATYETKKGAKTVLTTDVGHALTRGEIATMVNSLTPRQKEVADKLQKFMADQGGKWGNFVSVARFGEEMFGEEHYYPINSDGRHLQSTADEYPSAASLYALLNMSFTKELKEDASNRLILYSIFDVFSNHMASMAQYNAFALPILDSLKWFNYQQVEKDNDGNKTILGSVREQMARAYGAPGEGRPGRGSTGYAEKFVLNIIKAFNGTEAQGVQEDTFAVNALHRFNMSRVAFNLRVVVQQPMAITRAGMLIDYKSIIKGMKLSPAKINENIKEMQKYSGIAAWKSLGFYDVNISRGLTDIIKHNSNVIDKINDVGMWGAEKADLITWAAMWSACKEQVMRDNGRGDDRLFYSRVTKLFEDVIYKTQVVDSVLTKNEWMRSKGAFSRMTSSFMSEPTTTASMLLDAYDKYSMDRQRGMTRQQAWQRNNKNIMRLTLVMAISTLALAAATAGPDAWRDDDDYQTFLEKWLEAFKDNFIKELSPFSKLPIVSDLVDAMKLVLNNAGIDEILGYDIYGYEPNLIYMNWLKSLEKAAKAFNSIQEGKEGYTKYYVVYNLTDTASGMSGLPVSPIMREIVTLWNNTVGGMAPSLKVKTYDAGEKNNIKYAYRDGNLTEEEAIDKLIETGYAEDRNEAWFMIQESGKYDAVYSAIDSGNTSDFRSAMQELASHGVDADTVHGVARSHIKKALIEDDTITSEEAKRSLALFAGKTSDEANAFVDGWVFADEHPDLDWSDAQISKYIGEVKAQGISITDYDKFLTKIKNCTGVDADGDGKTDSGSKKVQVLAAIDSLNISYSQKDFLYYQEGYAASKINEAPWH